MVAEEEIFYEAITAEAKAGNEMGNDLRDEHKTKSYEDIMNIYIENMNTIEKRKKVYTKLRR